MLAAKTVELSRDEILRLIGEYCAPTGRDPHEVLRAFRRGEATDFERLSEAYALSELLADDDPIFED
jgi:hypothetical protein